MSKFLLFLFILQVFGAFGFPRSKREASSPIHKEIPKLLKYEGYDKLIKQQGRTLNPEKLLLIALNSWISKDKPGNITFIGWQTILNKDGEVEQVRTVELVFEGNSVNSTYLDADFNSIYEENRELMVTDIIHYVNDIKTYSGLDVVRSSQIFEYSGMKGFGFYLDSRDIYFPLLSRKSELPILMRNLTVKSLDDVKQFMEDNQGFGPSSLLVYDDLDTESINLSESVIVPQQIVSFTTQNNATTSMLEDAVKYIATAYLVDQENAGDYILSNMTESYPDYKWFMVEDSEMNEMPYEILIMYAFSDSVLSPDVKTIELYGMDK